MAADIPTNRLPSASPIIISQTPTYIVVAVEISRVELARHVRFLESLLSAASPGAVEDDE
jgi:hypothetical protein